MTMPPVDAAETRPIKTASFLELALNRFQIWALEHPDQFCSKALLPIIGLVEGVVANGSTYLDTKRLIFGPNYCCAGMVVLGEFKSVETALTSPQARTWRLAPSPLNPHHLPNLDVDGRNVFLLALSDQAAGGNGDHEAFYKCVQNYFMSEAATARQQDATAQKLLDQLAKDYQEMPHGPNGAFFTDDQRGFMGFMVRYLHYVLFGLDPDDQEKIGLLTNLHYTRRGTLYYYRLAGNLARFLNAFGACAWPKLIEQAATIYEESPALAEFQDDCPEYNGMTRRELAKLMTAMMSIAGLQGPLGFAKTAMGFWSLPAYEGQKTAEIDPTQYWDQLDLEDRDAVRRYLLECARLRPPVNASHRVATEPFTVKIAGKERTFPAGTLVVIPMILGMLDSGFWGPTTYAFDPQRENLCPYSMAFHSVGDRSAGRMCPGRDIALNMLLDVLITLGKVRRSDTTSPVPPG